MRENDQTADPPAGSAADTDVVSYRHSGTAQMRLITELGELMDAGARRFCDVGGGANPIVSERKITRLGLDYVLLDDSAEELAKAPSGYRTFRASILDGPRVRQLVEEGPFDVVTSRWTAEHMPDGEAFHRQVFAMLTPGGAAVHLFPTLYSPPFVVNRVLPGAASAALLDTGSGGRRSDEGRHPKFASYYSWCRGPTARQMARLRSVGFTVERYVGFYGHGYYRRVRPLDAIHRRATARLLEHPVASLTSFALVVLRRGR